MTAKLVLVLFLISQILYCSDALCRTENVSFARGASVTIKNLKLTGHVVKTVVVPSLISCSQLCLKHRQCVSTNYKQQKASKEAVCELNDVGLPGTKENKDSVEERGVVFSQFGKSIAQEDESSCPAEYAIEFPTKDVTNSVLMWGMPSLSQFTICFWMNSNDAGVDGTSISYAVQNRMNEIVIFNYHDFKIGVGIRTTGSLSVSATDGKWHHICVTWENTAGDWKFYKDGAVIRTGTGLSQGHVIDDGGVLVLGQDQDAAVGGGFVRAQSFMGQMTGVNIWDFVLADHLITEMSKSCLSGEGNVFKWLQFKYGLLNGVRVIDVSSCKP